MWKNYLKTSIRNLLNNKTYTVTNISGLSLGIVTCIMIALFVWDEKQFDTFVPQNEKIFRTYNIVSKESGESKMAIVSPMFKDVLQNNFPEVDTAIRIINYFGKAVFKKDNNIFYEDQGIYVEAQFLNFFGLKLLSGDSNTALSAINTIVLNRKLAEKYFPGIDPVGKILEIEGKQMEVTGVLADFSGNFHLPIGFLISFSTVEALIKPERMQHWNWQQFYTYIKLADGATIDNLQEKFQSYIRKEVHPILKERGFTYLPYFQNLKDIHLHSYDFEWEIANRGNGYYVEALSVVAIFIMLLACINFINLTTAQSVKRAKEVGIRKSAGAHRKQLIFQFLSESFLLVLLSVIIGGFLIEILIPYMNVFTDKQLYFNPFASVGITSSFLSFIITITLLSGFYPAIIISGYAPLTALKEYRGSGPRANQLRKGLVIFQFSISTLMIIGTCIIYKQLNFLQKKDYGFEKNQLVKFNIEGEKMQENLASFKDKMLQQTGVQEITACYGIPGGIVAGDGITISKTGEAMPVNLFTVDHEYIKTLGIQIIAGRDFDRNIITDSTEAFIINETAVKNLGFETPEKALGRGLNWAVWWAEEGTYKRGKIIGVVKDFHYKSLHQDVQTAVLQIFPKAYRSFVVKIDAKSTIPETLKKMKSVWESYEAEKPFDYHFIDASFDKAYRAEQKLGQLFIIFSIVSVLIACFGLFGLIAFSTAEKRKEISIRKVLGARSFHIIFLLLANYSRLILIAACAVLPVGYYLAKNWLNEFAYKITLSTSIFIIPIVLIIVIAWLTIAFHAIKAAFERPVNSLRSE
ncbi:MAG: ABC transporter permease [Bacteroidota bacterium]